MKTKNLFLATMMAVFTLGMTGCDKDDDRLFDDKELIEEPKDELTDEEKELEKKYPLSIIDYMNNLADNIVPLVETFLLKPGITSSRSPELVDFFKNNNNLRGYLYRSNGKSDLDKLEDTITFLLGEFNDPDGNTDFFMKFRKYSSNPSGGEDFYEYLIRFEKYYPETGGYVLDFIELSVVRELNGTGVGVFGYQIQRRDYSEWPDIGKDK